jgi:hypothetical protein
MRLLFAVAVALIVALTAAPSAHAWSLLRSMPRTARGPEGMARCPEEPMSLAFDIVEREAARFVTPESLTSRNDRLDSLLRTPARTHERPAQQAVNVRLGAAPFAARGARQVQSAPCGRSSVHMISCAAMSETEGSASVSPAATDKLLSTSLFDVSLPSGGDFADTVLRQPQPVANVIGDARDAHGLGPWRPPRA